MRRYGRNQKRRHLHEIQNLTEQLSSASEALGLSKGLSDHLGNELRGAREEISEAKRIAGEMSILFPAGKMDVPGVPRRHIQVQIDARKRIGLSAPCEQAAHFERLSLPVMMSCIDSDVFRRCIHLDVKFDDGRWGYAVEKEVLAMLPSDIIYGRILRALSRQISSDISANKRHS